MKINSPCVGSLHDAIEACGGLLWIFSQAEACGFEMGATGDMLLWYSAQE